MCLLAFTKANASADTTLLRTELGATDLRLFPGLVPLHTRESDRNTFAPDEGNMPDSVLERRAHAHALLQKVLASQRFLESLDALSEVNLPVGVVKAGGALDYMIIIDRIEFTRDGAIMDVYVSLAMPQTTTRLAFHGRVPLSASGGISSNARIFLLGDHTMKIGPHSILTVHGSQQSYVEFDCNGFLGVNVDASLQFSSDIIQREDENGTASDDRLSVGFAVYTQSLNNILVTIAVPPFQIKGLDGFGFRATEAYLDWSDLANPPGLAFPENYSSPFISAALDELWRGIYIREFSVRFPPAFICQSTPERLSVGARNMILDDTGVTGELYASNVFSDGNMNGWTYTLEHATLRLTSNEVTGFSLEGDLTIPVIKGSGGDDARFGYTAQQNANGDYVFAVAVREELKLDFWHADLKLTNGSHVVIREKDNRFYPSAHLNGELTINITSKEPKASFNSIRFEDMVIDSEPPHFRPGTFGFGRENHNSDLVRYPVVFTNIGIKSADSRAGISFDFLINLGGKPEDESFAGKATMTVWGIQDETPRRDERGEIVGLDPDSWRFDGVELSAVKINIRKPKVIELAGEVRFFNDDPIYGEGFKGKMKGKVQSIETEAEALFGRTTTYRYWYADALVELKTGIPIVPGVLSAFGFGGGYYSKMKQSDEPVEGTLGRSPSGRTYIPDENSVGIRAVVLIGTPRPEAMRGDVALEVVLNRHGGINSTTFTGNARFMSSESLTTRQIRDLATVATAGELTERLSSLASGQVFGNLQLHFDNINDIFHGNLEVYVNVAGGIVRGVGAGNKAGWAAIHFEKNNWYIHVGSPDQPLGLEVARIFKAKSYFMLGTDLPGSPPPPPQVSEILGGVDLDYMRDMNALRSGTGIAFGLHFLVDTGDLRFLMFYGRFSAGTGLDFMLKHYDSKYHCAGSSGSFGIDGWYANGQAYAFVMGKIGIRVNLRFYKGRYEILRIGAAAILQAKGPNPFWMRGKVGGHYRILGGLIKGRCNFEITIGEDCKPVAEENLLEDINMIAALTPENGARDVSVFNTPQLVFNIPVGETFTVADMEENTHHFRAVLNSFTVADGTKTLTGQLIWNEDKHVVVFDPSDLLPGNTQIAIAARLSFEERINGVWLPVHFENKPVTETIDAVFETSAAPDFIPPANVAYAYPAPNQSSYYPRERNVGFIQLKSGQPYLFGASTDWAQRIRITEVATARTFETALSYDQATQRIAFELPTGLDNDREHQLQIVSMPTNIREIDSNVATAEQELLADDAGTTATVTTQIATGSIDRPEEKPIYVSRFRTSRYDSFADKMKAVHLSDAMRVSNGINIFQLVSRFQGDERMHQEELGENGFIRMEAILNKNRWYEDHVHPLLYNNYPLLGWMTVTRSDRLGIPPVRDLYAEHIHPGGDASLSARMPFTSEVLVYNVGQSVAQDFYDLQRHAVNYFADHGPDVPDRIRALIVAPLPYLRFGTYGIRFNYVIPGINELTSSYETELFNRIPDPD